MALTEAPARRTGTRFVFMCDRKRPWVHIGSDASLENRPEKPDRKHTDEEVAQNDEDVPFRRAGCRSRKHSRERSDELEWTPAAPGAAFGIAQGGSIGHVGYQRSHVIRYTLHKPVSPGINSTNGIDPFAPNRSSGPVPVRKTSLSGRLWKVSTSNSVTIRDSSLVLVRPSRDGRVYLRPKDEVGRLQLIYGEHRPPQWSHRLNWLGCYRARADTATGDGTRHSTASVRIIAPEYRSRTRKVRCQTFTESGSRLGIKCRPTAGQQRAPGSLAVTSISTAVRLRDNHLYTEITDLSRC